MVNSRGLSLFMCSICSLSNGVAYGYGIFSGELKNQFHLSQTQISWLGTAIIVGAYLCYPAGLLCDRKGPNVTIAVGGAVGLLSWVAVWYIVSHVVNIYWLLFTILLLIGHGSAYADQVSMTSAVRNYPSDYVARIVGYLKTYTGFSGSFLAVVYTTFFAPSVHPFLLFIGIATAGVGVLGVFLLHREQGELDNDVVPAPHSLWINNFACLGIIATLMISSWYSSYSSDPQRIVLWCIFAVLMVLLLLPAVGAGIRDTTRDSSTETLLKQLVPKSSTLREAMGTVEFWLLGFAMSLSIGSGMGVINNLAQLEKALRNNGPNLSNFCIVLLGAGSSLGRVGVGNLSEWIVKRLGIGRAWILLCCDGIFSVTLLATSVVGHGALPVNSFIIGFSYGAQWMMLPTLTAELFGRRHIGAVYSFYSLFLVMTAVGLGTLLPGHVYDENAKAQGTYPVCNGQVCFSKTLLVYSSCVSGAMVLVFGLAWRMGRRERVHQGVLASINQLTPP